ncbi:hypothetical protein EGT36_29540 [Agrobacterium sp. FDAARGOS_525]|uniref:DotI/IcmL/TraM family protein n=1 Tax=Agrobacterium sp. FDAARGOS_525 TaxID=2420311 RepID=UPI000F68D684|nr:DotI/IcmL/TraM family protein [Agrobacterium sp. FDAARGOS_525]RSC21585.1 hypothetical protein EGT36_29540 [Agrobacterium sp. FDAARGOS_525]
MTQVVDALWQSRAMFGFGKKQKSVELPRFRFATLPDPIAPTIATEDILQKQKIIVGLGTLLISLTVISLSSVFLSRALRRRNHMSQTGCLWMPRADLERGGKVKTKEEILEASAAQSAIQRNMKVFIVLLVIGNAVMALHVGQLLYARFVKFPDTAFLGTTDAQSVCAPIGLDEPMVADAVARDFAVEAIRAISTYDWTSWRDQINSSTAQYMTLDARNSYRISVNDWGIIRML